MFRFLRLALLCSGLLFCISTLVHAASPRAERGEIDVSAVDMANGDTVSLNGEWEFYWNRLLGPDDFRDEKSLPEPAYISVPKSWAGVRINGIELPALGHATYRLKIKPGPGNLDLELRLPEVASAFKLWVNGRFIMENGIVGDSPETETAYQAVRFPRFPGNGGTIEVLLQVSNYHYRNAGLVSPIQFGASRTLDVDQVKRWGWSWLVIGCLLIMGLYHIVLYGIRKANLALFWFGMYCVLWAISILFGSASDWAIRVYWQWASSAVLYRVEMVSFFATVPVGYAFFENMYPEQFSKHVLRAAAAVSIVYIVLALLLSPLDLSNAVPIYFYCAMALIGDALARLFMACRAKKAGACVILAGFMVVGMAGVNDMLNDLQLIHSVSLIPEGMLVFIVAQAFALSLRYVGALSSVESLSEKLETQNAALQDEMAQRIRLEREIVHVSEEERRNISRDLHDGLCQQLTAARLHCSVLQKDLARGVTIQGDAEKLAALLEEAVDQAYELSRGLWPVEHDSRSLITSLEEMATSIHASYGVDVSLHCDFNCHGCSNSNASQIHHIAKEALLNTCKHAKAQNVKVVLDCRSNMPNLVLRVEDDGVGRMASEPSKGGLGIQIMAHRAKTIGGKLTIADRSGGGTIVTLNVPCDAQFYNHEGASVTMKQAENTVRMRRDRFDPARHSED